jgi:nucleotide-binding universal stress UspA family protein
MKTIIVPVNFSPCAENAARYAADLALAINADLQLVHVIQTPVSPAELTMTQSTYEEMVEIANNLLQTLQVGLLKRTTHRIKISIILVAGNVGIKVQQLSERIKPFTIVLGASGPTLEKFLAGSPDASLLRNSKYPVLVVPETATFQEFRTILLACDLEDIGSDLPNTFPLLKELRDHFGSTIDMVTVETRRVLSDEQNMFEPGCWKDQFKDLYPNVIYIRNPKVEDGIREYLDHHSADLIMVFPKKHGLLDFHISQSRKVAIHSPIPVLSLHA